ncbi:hypothetical protein ACQEWB_03055 [Streptomyces sp. CA-249302]|uniref:hypothetical protein n=1 Tax=Streptomyces sp. CA-249302 TaxID=3240058 RepID=UPI003D8A8C25
MTGLVHQALRYRSEDEFLYATPEFVSDGLDAGDAVLAVVAVPNLALNVAFAGSGHWILCPYDTRTLPEAVVHGVARAHPELVHERGSAYTDPAVFSTECDAHRPDRLPAGPDGSPFSRGRSATVRPALTAYARRLGLPEQRT